tara:strand:- start:53 stop:1273 length:1221 start_codon:yes stop_codon:yes gene_type:complete
MASFKVQVEDLIGAVGDDDLITQALINSGTKIIKLMPAQKLRKYSDESTISTSGLAIDNRKVLQVHIDNYIASEIEYVDKAKYIDANSIYYAQSRNPVFYYQGEKIYALEGGSLSAAKLIYVPKQPTGDGTNLITSASSSTQYFPLEAEYLMVLGSCLHCLQRLMSDKTASLPNDIPSVTLPPAPTTPSSPSFTYTDASVDDIIQPLVSISDMATLSVSAPEYANPVVSLDFGKVKEFIDTDEDVELASVKLQEISSQISKYSTDIQDALNDFNKDNVAYQEDINRKIQNFNKDIQVAMQNAQQEFNSRKSILDKDVQLNLQNAINNFQKDVQEYQSSLSKYSADIQKYQSETGSVIQNYSVDMQNFSAKIQKHVADYQWKQGQYAQLKAEYTEGLQVLIGGNPQE